MKTVCCILVGIILLSGCADRGEPVAPERTPSPGISIELGQEVNTNNYYRYIPLRRQDTVTLASIGGFDNITARISETGISSEEALNPSIIVFTASSRYDTEQFRLGVNCRLRAIGGSSYSPELLLFVEAVFPQTIVAQPTLGNGVLEFQDNEDEFVQITYSSPFSSLKGSARLTLVR